MPAATDIERLSLFHRKKGIENSVQQSMAWHGSKEEGTSASSMLERQLRFNELAVHTGDEGEA
jgi:hypothetical protein